MALGRTYLVALLSLYCFTVLATGDESAELQGGNEKRYIAALAKNGRLPPKPGHRSEEKREEGEGWPSAPDGEDLPAGADPADLFYFNDEDSHEADKRYLGAFLKSRGRPQGVEDKRFVGAFFNSRGKPNPEEAGVDKRFVGAFFNSRGKPEDAAPGADKRFVGAFFNSRGKPEDAATGADKRFVGAFFNSRGKPEDAAPGADKRFVGAFFNSRGKPEEAATGSDKRFVGAFFNSRGKPNPEEAAPGADKRFVGAFFNSRGKPNPEEVDGDGEDEDPAAAGKRNIASLARKGWLSAMRSYRSPVGSRMPTPRRYSSYNDKRDDSLYSDEPRVLTSDGVDDCLEQEEEGEVRPNPEKRNIAFLARNGMLPPRKSSFSDPFSLKRNRPSFLPQSAQLRWPLPAPKRLTSGQLRLVKLKPRRCLNLVDAKRNVAAMARKGLLPDKKNVASMARKGLLPAAK